MTAADLEAFARSSRIPAELLRGEPGLVRSVERGEITHMSVEFESALWGMIWPPATLFAGSNRTPPIRRHFFGR